MYFWDLLKETKSFVRGFMFQNHKKLDEHKKVQFLKGVSHTAACSFRPQEQERSYFLHM